jgi:WD40 repeat protein
VQSPSVAFSPNAAVLAVGYGEGSVRLWDVGTGTVARTLAAHADALHAVAFSPDGRTLATGSARGLEQGPGEIKLWDVASGRQRWVHKLERGVLAVAFSPDGRTLAVGENYRGGPPNDIKILDAATGRLSRSLPQADVRLFGTFSSVAFSPDGKTLAAGNWNQTVPLWNLATGRVVRRLKCAAVVDSVAFSPDGRRLVTGSGDGAVKLWDVGTGREILTLQGSKQDTWVAFSPDGRRLAAGSLQPEVLLWESATPREVAAREARGRTITSPVAR